MLGRGDWLPARAEPLWHSAGRPVSEGQEDDFGAQLDVQWRVHIEGREPYEFEERNRRAPIWVVKGERRGKRWFHPRLRATHGLLREVGVPCRVHPEKPHKIDIDWSRAYDEHEPHWHRMDAIAKGVSLRREGPLAKVLAPIEYIRLPKFTAQEQQAIDRAIDEEVERQDAATHTGATTALPTQTLQAESELIQEELKQAKQLRKHGIQAFATVLELRGPTGPASWFYTARLEVHLATGGTQVVEHSRGMNYAATERFKPGARIRVYYDPADPRRIAMAG